MLYHCTGMKERERGRERERMRKGERDGRRKERRGNDGGAGHMPSVA